MKCEFCLSEHKGEYGSGRFCDAKCARGFSTSLSREAINKTVSNKLKGRKNPYAVGFSDKQRQTAAVKRHEQQVKLREWKIENVPFCELTKINKKHKLLKEQNFKCAICNMDAIWNNKPLVFQMDHVDGNHQNISKENLRMICPNCHSQTDTFTSKNISEDGLRRLKEATSRMRQKYGEQCNVVNKRLRAQYDAHNLTE